MKKQLFTLLLAAVLLYALTGCAVSSAAQKLEPAENKPSLAAPAPAAEKSQELLTKEQTQQIALDYLGITQEQVSRLHVTFEIDDGIPQYDVEFYHGDWEYEFEIHAENGQILSYDKDHKYD